MKCRRAFDVLISPIPGEERGDWRVLWRYSSAHATVWTVVLFYCGGGLVCLPGILCALHLEGGVGGGGLLFYLLFQNMEVPSTFVQEESHFATSHSYIVYSVTILFSVPVLPVGMPSGGAGGWRRVGRALEWEALHSLCMGKWVMGSAT
jgi:hypothetical protein